MSLAHWARAQDALFLFSKKKKKNVLFLERGHVETTLSETSKST